MFLIRARSEVRKDHFNTFRSMIERKGAKTLFDVAHHLSVRRSIEIAEAPLKFCFIYRFRKIFSHRNDIAVAHAGGDDSL